MGNVLEKGGLNLLTLGLDDAYNAYRKTPLSGVPQMELAKKTARKQEQAAKQLHEDEERSRLQTIMRMQKRRGIATDTLLTRSQPPMLGMVGGGQLKTLLGS